MAFVGTRKSTSVGRQITEEIAGELASSGVTIVSGLARGIDGAAHQGALSRGGRTIAVLASGVDIIYPPEHRVLAQRITESGALVSDYPPGTKPDPAKFPARNRLISGLALGTVVVEAPRRKRRSDHRGFCGRSGQRGVCGSVRTIVRGRRGFESAAQGWSPSSHVRRGHTRDLGLVSADVTENLPSPSTLRRRTAADGGDRLRAPAHG
ncbi:MAG: DNA-processing protein DprA [Thermomicrobiales bacterium]